MPESWTRDAAGNYVRWNESPHYVGCVVDYRLPGETRLSDGEIARRRSEFLLLQQRSLRRKKDRPRA